MKGYMYILLCANGKYYTGSTKNILKRLKEHQAGLGANFTRKHLPVVLLYYEEYERIDQAFYREKQVQGWCRKKKEALFSGNTHLLPDLATAYRNKRDGIFKPVNKERASKYCEGLIGCWFKRGVLDLAASVRRGEEF